MSILNLSHCIWITFQYASSTEYLLFQSTGINGLTELTQYGTGKTINVLNSESITNLFVFGCIHVLEVQLGQRSL